MPANGIRTATPADAAAVRAIYAFHVAHGTASFDTEAPDEAFWRGKIAQVTARGWPFLVAESSGAVIGHAYATQFRDRAAYVHTCENSIYVADGMRRKGVGRGLLNALVQSARAAGFECRLDAGAFRRCRSPKRYRLGRGQHVFRVRSVTERGRPGPAKAWRFRIRPGR